MKPGSFISEQATQRQQQPHNRQWNPDDGPNDRQANDYPNDHERQPQDYGYNTASKCNNPTDEFPESPERPQEPGDTSFLLGCHFYLQLISQLF